MSTQDNLSVRSLKLVQHFPSWVFLYSLLLTVFAAISVYVYDALDGSVSLEAGSEMYAYITLIIAWLVTARPVYALEVHDKLTTQLSELMEDLIECGGGSNLAKHIVTSISTRSSNLPYSLTEQDKTGIKNQPNLKSVLKKFRAFQMQQRLAMPAALHGMCVLLVFMFHVLFAPILLYANNLSILGVLISNYIMAIYTTGCLEVALLLENPYTHVYTVNYNPAISEYQTFYRELRASIDDSNEGFPILAELPSDEFAPMKGTARGKNQKYVYTPYEL